MANNDLTRYFEESLTIARNSYREIVELLTGVISSSEDNTDSTINRISTSLTGVRDSIVSKLKDVTSSITGVLQGWLSRLSEPIKDIVVPIMAVAATLFKIFKMMKRRDSIQTRSIIDWIKDIFTKSLFVVGIAIGLVVGLIWEKIRAPIAILGAAFRDIEILFNSFKGRLLLFTNMFRTDGALAGVSVMVNRITTWLSEFLKLDVMFARMGSQIRSFRYVMGEIGAWFELYILESRFVTGIINKVKGAGKFISNMFKGISAFMDIFGLGGGSFMAVIGKLLPGITAGMRMASKLFIPLQILLSAFDFIGGYMKDNGNIGSKIMSGIQAVFRGLIEGLTKPLEWVLGWMGINSKGLSDKLVGILLPLFNIVMTPFLSLVNFVRGFMESDSEGLWGKIKDGFSKAFKGILDSFNKLAQGVGSIFGMTDTSGLLNGVIGIGKFFSKFAGFLGKIFLPLQVIMSAFNFIEGFMSTNGNIGDKLIGGVKGIFRGLVEGFTKPLEWVLGWIGIESAGLSDKILGFLVPMFGMILTPFQMISDFISGFASGGDWWDGIKKGVSKMFTGIFDSMLAMLNGFLNLFSLDSLKQWISEVPWIGEKFKQMLLKGTTTASNNVNAQDTSSNSGSTSKGTWPSGKGSTASEFRAKESADPSVVGKPPILSASAPMSDSGGGGIQTGIGGYQSSPEATNWFNSSTELNNLLKEWLKSSMNKGGVGNTTVNSTNVSQQSNDRPSMSLSSIPTDIENLGILLMNKTWGLA